MNAEAPMNGGAINAKEDPKRNRRPSRVLRITIETDLNKKKKNKNKNKNQLNSDPKTPKMSRSSHSPCSQAWPSTS